MSYSVLRIPYSVTCQSLFESDKLGGPHDYLGNGNHSGARGVYLGIDDRYPVIENVSRRTYTVLRYSRIEMAAAAPSPTAEATCLVLPCRSSPAAKTPAQLVSKANGSRFSITSRLCPRSCPVRTKPAESNSTA